MKTTLLAMALLVLGLGCGGDSSPGDAAGGADAREAADSGAGGADGPLVDGSGPVGDAGSLEFQACRVFCLCLGASEAEASECALNECVGQGELPSTATPCLECLTSGISCSDLDEGACQAECT